MGPGWEDREFQAVGQQRAERGGRTDESIAIIRRLLAGEINIDQAAETIDRSRVYVSVFNNTNVTGLAGDTAARIGAAGAELCLTLLRCVGVISRPTGA